ncbi:hypothetical protein PMZ80_010537 [Knufia obscura]|uniref:Uncharacterized protein n=2 Tax=Knufia TaxID=430999 RepID=A0AAN8EBI2_9EURO|nr:hypothetical protein PMZ80_010537 [Knufia obscura]KAK5950110.1 hypothetical protein OHC33_008825 [Knufia fluminis]
MESLPTRSTPHWVEPTHLNTLITRVSAVEPTHLNTLVTRVSTANPTPTHLNTLITRVSARAPPPPYLLTYHRHHTSISTPTTFRTATSIQWTSTPTSRSSPTTFPSTNNILPNGYIIALIIAAILLLFSGIAALCVLCFRGRRRRSKPVSSNSIAMTPRPTPSELENQQSPVAPRKVGGYSYNPAFNTRDLCWRCMKEGCGGEVCPRHSGDVFGDGSIRTPERVDSMRAKVYRKLGRVGTGESSSGSGSGSGTRSVRRHQSMTTRAAWMKGF